MKTISAVLCAKPGAEETLRAALLDVAAHVAENEPDTVGFFVSQDAGDPARFTTYERFTDAAAMDRHNGSAAVARFFAVAQPILDGEVILVTAEEISCR
ncbi:putative quinol monooxygenase [Methylobacterium sp. Gmos1]